MQERRTEVRMLCADVVEVWWKSTGGTRQCVTGLLEDISHSGACLQLEDPLPVGMQVHWRAREREFTGHVRYCVHRPEIGYFVGVEFAAACKWSRRSFRPRHLLDLQKLVQQA